MPTLAVTSPFGFEGYDLDRFHRTWADLGCEACQLLREKGTSVDPAQARAVVERAGLRFDGVHGRFKESIDISAPDDEATRQRSVAALIEDGDLALALGARIVIVHPAAVRSPEERRRPVPAAVVDRRWAAFERSMAELAEAGDRQGVIYAMENLPRSCWIGNDAPDLARRVREFAAPSIGMCFDTGHAHLEPTSAAPTCAAQFALCADVVTYVHVHDNAGDEDSHLMPGDGTIDWDRLGEAFATLAPPNLTLMYELFHTDAEMSDRLRSDPGLPARLRRACGQGAAG